MPEEMQAWTPNEELLRVVKIGADLGIHKIRVTGGEPPTRPGVVEFCAGLARISGINDVGISTNGTLLGKVESPHDRDWRLNIRFSATNRLDI